MKLLHIIGDEFRNIFKDEGALLLVVGALLIYSALYGFIYAPEVVRQIPVAVVDNDNTPLSRQLTHMVDATPDATVAYKPTTLESAKELFLQHKVSGVLLIPDGFADGIGSGLQSHVLLYADGSYFLLYGSFMSTVSDVTQAMGAQIKTANLLQLGLSEPQAKATSMPVNYKVETLYNPSSGYAAALLPSVLIVIIQQVLLIGIGLVVGSCNEFRGWGKYRDASTFKILMGKTIAYCLLYIPMLIYIFGADYKFFGYPMRENTWEMIAFLVPYILSLIFLGHTLGGLFARRESSIMYLVSLSIFFVMISGISWAWFSMPSWLFGMGQIFPSSSAIDGFVRIRTCGATLGDVMPQFTTLWILTFVYGATALLSLGRARRKFGDDNH